jgi:ABA DEFICIENT 4-like
MELETVFSVASTLAAVPWLALSVVPLRSRWPIRLARIAAAALAMLYLALVASFWTRAHGGFGSLAEVSRLFEEDGLLLAGWVHYLAFDLLVGSWEREEASRIGFSRWLLIPCLFSTFMFGPAGWLSFLAVRRFQQTRPV